MYHGNILFWIYCKYYGYFQYVKLKETILNKITTKQTLYSEKLSRILAFFAKVYLAKNLKSFVKVYLAKFC